jgi:leucyl aminopeptidase
VKTEILDEVQIEKLGMGLLLGVARGSAEPPRVMVFRYDPPGAPQTPVLGLVGKGITFDTGGISIKPAAGMGEMKWDMAGAGVVIGLMRLLATRGAKVLGTAERIEKVGVKELRQMGRVERPVPGIGDPQNMRRRLAHLSWRPSIQGISQRQ